jgi:hypothetical protein
MLHRTPLCTICYLVLLSFHQLPAQKSNLETYISAWDSLSCIEVERGADFQDSTFWTLDNLEDILGLTQHPNPLIRAKTLLLLLNREGEDQIPFVSLMAEHLRDTSTVKFCFSWDTQPFTATYSLATLYASLVAGANSMVLFYVPGKRFTADSLQKRQLDSLILCQYLPDLKERQSVALSAPVYPDFLPILRRNVSEQQDQDALIYLSRFQQAQDVDLILHQLNQVGMEKVWIPLLLFQHPRLLDTLGYYLDTQWNNSRYINIIAKYKNEQAAQLLQAVYQRKQAETNGTPRVSDLQRALEQNFTSAYADLLLQCLSQNQATVHQPLPDSLWTIHGDSLLQLFHQWENSDKQWERRSAKKIYDQAKAYQEVNYPDELVPLIMSQIQPGSKYLDSATSLWHIWQTRDPDFVTPLFELLDQEPLGVNRFIILKILHHYEEEGINERLRQWVDNHSVLVPTIADAQEGGRFFNDLEYYGKKK